MHSRVPTLGGSRKDELSASNRRSTTAGRIQAKLEVGRADDSLELEADRTAAIVMQRLGVGDPREPREEIPGAQRSLQDHRDFDSLGSAGGAVGPATDRAIDQNRGTALDPVSRSSMESAFGADFSTVRIHAGPAADNLNNRLAARAFTTGSDVFIRSREYAPHSAKGQRFLAHELTHVVQQRAVPLTSTAQSTREAALLHSPVERNPIQRMVVSGNSKNPSPPYWSSFENDLAESERTTFDDYDEAADYDVKLAAQRKAATAKRVAEEKEAAERAAIAKKAAQEQAAQEAYEAEGCKDPLVLFGTKARKHYKDHDPAREPAETWIHSDAELTTEVVESWSDATQQANGDWEIYLGNKSVKKKGGGYWVKGCNILMRSGRNADGRWWAEVYHCGPTIGAG